MEPGSIRGFQAPIFYERVGYREFGRLEEFPRFSPPLLLETSAVGDLLICPRCAVVSPQPGEVGYPLGWMPHVSD